MATLYLKRAHRSNRSPMLMKILLNKQSVGLLDDGEILELPIDAGKHTLQAKLGFSHSKPLTFQIAADDACLFEFAYVGVEAKMASSPSTSFSSTDSWEAALIELLICCGLELGGYFFLLIASSGPYITITQLVP